MIAVIFEVWPADGAMANYLDIAASLRSELAEIDGFISVERFESLTEPGKLLSLSFFRDEKAVGEWRNRMSHRQAQKAGRNGVFSNYRLRFAHVVRDYGLENRTSVPVDSFIAHP